jgi:hypothetical protein
MGTCNAIEINPFRQAAAICVGYCTFIHDATMATRRQHVIRLPYMALPHCLVTAISLTTSVLLTAGHEIS